MTQTPHGSLALVIPPVPDPHRYAGLFVYDFGSHVSVGYTAAEIDMLRQSDQFRSGKAYQIYRVNEQGGFELLGIQDRPLSETEAMCFLRKDPESARKDFQRIRDAADHDPIPCSAELQIARLDAFDPPEVIALTYAATSSTVVAQWLLRNAPNLGDRVEGGSDVHVRLQNSGGHRHTTCRLGFGEDRKERTQSEVLASTDQPLQR